LAFEERIHAFRFQQFEVFNHAHAVAFSVPLVKMGKFLAGHGVAFAARLKFMFG